MNATSELKAECPICGHTAVVVIEDNEKTIYCPDQYCPNCKDKPRDLAA